MVFRPPLFLSFGAIAFLGGGGGKSGHKISVAETAKQKEKMLAPPAQGPLLKRRPLENQRPIPPGFPKLVFFFVPAYQC